MVKSTDKSKPAVKKQDKQTEELHDFVVEFRKYKTELTEKYRNRTKWQPRDDSKVISFIPGTITKIFVKEGDVVKAGQELMVLEAMKMKNIVFAEASGVVKKVNASLGVQIPRGKVIFELELSES